MQELRLSAMIQTWQVLLSDCKEEFSLKNSFSLSKDLRGKNQDLSNTYHFQKTSNTLWGITEIINVPFATIPRHESVGISLAALPLIQESHAQYELGHGLPRN